MSIASNLSRTTKMASNVAFRQRRRRQNVGVRRWDPRSRTRTLFWRKWLQILHCGRMTLPGNGSNRLRDTAQATGFDHKTQTASTVGHEMYKPWQNWNQSSTHQAMEEKIQRGSPNGGPKTGPRIWGTTWVQQLWLDKSCPPDCGASFRPPFWCTPGPYIHRASCQGL